MHTLKYPSSQHLSSGTTAKEKLASQRTQQKRLTRPQFHSYMNQLTTGMEPSEVEEFIDYLSTSVKVRLLPQVHTHTHSTNSFLALPAADSWRSGSWKEEERVSP